MSGGAGPWGALCNVTYSLGFPASGQEAMGSGGESMVSATEGLGLRLGSCLYRLHDLEQVTETLCLSFLISKMGVLITSALSDSCVN